MQRNSRRTKFGGFLHLVGVITSFNAPARACLSPHCPREGTPATCAVVDPFTYYGWRGDSDLNNFTSVRFSTNDSKKPTTRRKKRRCSARRASETAQTFLTAIWNVARCIFGLFNVSRYRDSPKQKQKNGNAVFITPSVVRR